MRKKRDYRFQRACPGSFRSGYRCEIACCNHSGGGSSARWREDSDHRGQ